MFFLGAHLTECTVEAIRAEKRIVTKASGTAWRPHCDPVNAAFEFLHMAIGPGKTQRGDEMRAPLLGRFRAAFDQQRLNLIHSGAKILAGSCPSRRVNTRFAIKC